jgi:hypothetical protein
MNPQQAELIQAFKNSSNPVDFLQNMVSTNPQGQMILNLFQNSGMTPKQFFYQYAQQNGLDPSQIVKS